MDLIVSEISKQIYNVRGVRVMLDSDLAYLYQTETRTLNQTVRRNVRRFPEDFMFQLHKDEFEVLISQIVTSKKETRGGRQKLPLAFTELGVGMLSCILNNDRAIQVSITAVRAFAQVRQLYDSQTELMKKVDYLVQGFQELKQAKAHLESRFDAHLGSNHIYQQSLPAHVVPTDTRRPVVFVGKTQVDKIEDILVAVAKYFELTMADLKATTRVKSVAVPRQIAIYLIRKRVGVGFKEIGKCFGGKDHTTILHAYRKISDAVCKSGLIPEAVAAIENSIQQEVK